MQERACGQVDFKSLTKIGNPFKRQGGDLQETANAPTGPGGLCILPSGEYVISCHQFFNPRFRVLKFTKRGNGSPFPAR